MQTYLLHELLESYKKALDEFSEIDLVVIEVPANSEAGFELRLARLIARLMSHRAQVAVVSVPHNRRQSQMALWLHRWNRLDPRPFTFIRTCSGVWAAWS